LNEASKKLNGKPGDNCPLKVTLLTGENNEDHHAIWERRHNPLGVQTVTDCKEEERQPDWCFAWKKLPGIITIGLHRNGAFRI